jgi:hypothetical protein
MMDAVSFSASLDVRACRDQTPYCGGQVFFYDGERTHVIGSAPVTKGGGGCVASLGTSSLTAGKHRITGRFVPPSPFLSSTAWLEQVITKWPSTITVTSDPNPSTYGQDVTFTVTTSSNIEDLTGKVRFFNGSTPFAVVILDGNGMATLTKKNLPVGTNAILVEYLGDDISAKNTSSVLNQVVNQP